MQATVSGSKVSASQVKAWGVISAAVTTRAHQQDGLTNGTAYRFLLRAVYRSDEGAPAAAGATPTAAPSKPTGFGVTAGRGEARLKWKVSTDTFLDKYQYRYKTDGSYGAWTDMLPARLCTLPAGEYPPDNNNRTKDCTVTDDLFYRVTGLDDGTTYTFQIRGFINSGPGGYPGTASDEVSATTPQSVPNWPANFSARAGNARIDMSWDKPPADSGITKWEIRYIKSNGAWVGWNTFTPTTDGNKMSHELTELTNDVWYQVEVRACNSDACGISRIAVLQLISPLAAPASLTATAGDERATLAWTTASPADSRILKWDLQRKRSTESSYGPWKRISGFASDRSYTVTGLTNGVTYDFKVRATMMYGVGAASQKASARPLPASSPAKPANFAAKGATPWPRCPGPAWLTTPTRTGPCVSAPIPPPTW